MDLRIELSSENIDKIVADLDILSRNIYAMSPYNSTLKKLNHYLTMIQKIGRNPCLNFCTPKKIITNQNYCTKFTILKEYYPIAWSIDKALEIINRDNISVTKYEINKLNLGICETEKIKFEKLNSIGTIFEPIILVDYALIKKNVLIDGTHRAYIARGNNQQHIDAFILSPEQSLECMLTDDFRTIYKVVNNFIKINNELVLKHGMPKYSKKQAENTIFYI